MTQVHPAMDVLDGPVGLQFVHINYTTAFQMPLHTHEDMASLNFCLRGNLQEIRHDDRKQQTLQQESASLSFMPAGVRHANRFSAGTSTFLIVLGAPWMQRLRQVSTLLDSPSAVTADARHGSSPACIGNSCTATT